MIAVTAFGVLGVSSMGAEPKKPTSQSTLSSKDRAFFETKIRPVLVEYCYACHAEGAKKIGGKLRLDLPEALRKGGESGPVVVAGQPEKSLIIQALRYEHLEMPPKKPLPASVIKDFEDWVKMGAPDPRGNTKPNAKVNTTRIDLNNPALWSFRPVTKPAPPAVKDASWPRDPMDRFVLAKMQKAGLSPTSDAQPAVLVRRLYFDLIGLPPTMEQVRSFESDYAKHGSAAVERLVDGLLASPHFGERWGRHWLDVARYGESNGNDGLGRNPTFPHAWRYRDYVIQSFNEDVPYDRFITEQIAGDLLPAKNAAQRDRQLIATGFLALGSKPAKAMNINFDMDVVDDQINVVSAGVMGLSVSCARCHDHKHDPIPTRDYYALAGIFKSTETMWGKAANEKLTAPVTPLHELKSVSIDGQSKGEAATKPKAKKPTALAPMFDQQYPKAIAELKPVVYASLQSQDKALKVEPGVSLSADGFGAFKSGRIKVTLNKQAAAYTVSFWFLNALPSKARPVTAYVFSFGPDSKAPAPGDHLGLSGSYNKTAPGRMFIFNGNQRKQSITGAATLPPGTWNHVVYVRNGKRVKAFVNGSTKPDFDGEIDRTALNAKTFFIGGRNDRFAPLQGGVAHFAFYDRELSTAEIGQLHQGSGQPKGSSKAYIHVAASAAKPEPKALAMGVRDRAKPSDCKVNIKGESNKLGPVVLRGFIHACEQGSPSIAVNKKQSGRLELAKWLMRREHPQTSRVMVNRIWLHLFGRGIVDTPDDFGVYGSRPSHPQLLDHLATRLVEEGWSIKRMIRSIVLSRTYQLSSRADGTTIDSDPDNRWLARHSRRRLDAESLRDAMLLVSGQLDQSPGKGSIIQNMDVLVNQSGSLHKPSNHRSVYLCMLRNSPPPELAAFNLPQFTDVKGRRDVTTLPSHALFLLNNPFVIQQSKHFARQTLASVGNDSNESKVRWAYRRALNREPDNAELLIAIKFLDTVYQSLVASNSKAEQREFETWAALCQSLLATNEFRYVD